MDKGSLGRGRPKAFRDWESEFRQVPMTRRHQPSRNPKVLRMLSPPAERRLAPRPCGTSRIHCERAAIHRFNRIALAI